MPDDNSASLLRDITINGQDFQIEVPYTEGHVLTAKEASQLNQVYLENIGNNFRAKVKEMMESGASADAIQAELDKYAETYEFGSRRLGSGGGRKADPLAKEMRNLAKKKLEEFFKKQNVSWADLSSEEKEEAIKKYFERHGDALRSAAQARLDLAASLAAMA